MKRPRPGWRRQGTRLRKSRLIAPFSGIAAFRDVEPGEVIPPGMIISRIVDLDRMKIKLSINENDIAVLKKHPRLDFSVDALAGETSELPARFSVTHGCGVNAVFSG